MGRPKIVFTERETEQVKKLAQCHCPNEEIADFLGCSTRTLERRFRKILSTHRRIGIAGIRAKQYELAMKGNVTMLIWVGKQICGQSDQMKNETNLTHRVVTINKLNGDKEIYQTQLIEKPPVK